MVKSNLTVEKVSEKSADVLIDGCKVKLHFAPDTQKSPLDSIQNLLLNSLTHVSAYEKKS